MYSNALGEVSKLRSSTFLENEDGYIVSDIRKLCSDLDVVSISHMSRSCNNITHNFARHAITISSPLL